MGPLGFMALMSGDHGEPQAPSTGALLGDTRDRADRPMPPNSAYRSGRSPDWLKMKNPNAPAVTREAEEDWGQRAMAVTTAGKNRIMIYAPKAEGTYLVEFRTAAAPTLKTDGPSTRPAECCPA
jgi:hypothetical protein